MCKVEFNNAHDQRFYQCDSSHGLIVERLGHNKGTMLAKCQGGGGLKHIFMYEKMRKNELNILKWILTLGVGSLRMFQNFGAKNLGIKTGSNWVFWHCCKGLEQ